MGLAERFKDKLNNKDIFEKSEKSLNDGNIQYISKPITENIYVHPKDIHSGSTDNIEKIMELGSKYNEKSTAQLEDLETEIIDKIRKTPYWEDYSSIQMENMIGKYFDNKIKTSGYSGINYSLNDKRNFIKNILALTSAQ